MPTLDVPGATLRYEVAGEGPLLLGIHGGDGSGEIWRGISEILKDDFRFVFYDRRGFSQSYLTGVQDYSQRLETDADDAAQLIKHLSPDSQAIVIGNSSGAIVSFKLLARHPNLVSTVLPYEPPAARFLPDFEALYTSAQDVYTTYRAAGMIAGYKKFAKLIIDDGTMIGNMPVDDVRLNWNAMYWFEREFMAYPNADIDIDQELKPHKDKLILINGQDSNEEAYQFRANVALARRLGLAVVLFPGGHIGHKTHAVDFAAKLVDELAKRGR